VKPDLKSNLTQRIIRFLRALGPPPGNLSAGATLALTSTNLSAPIRRDVPLQEIDTCRLTPEIS
jgi:hypothetical protein